ncbi:MAG: Gfo/Idh/MocA family oxidoreductase [bacterium]|nr:Gfo/Idh/MocA family oxidoreductase [bacterium]
MENHKKFKAAIIGLGFIGAGDEVSGRAIGQDVRNLDGTHSEALAKNPHIILVAGSSRDEGRRNRFSEKFPGVRTYSDWRELLKKEKPDIVSIATHTPYHAEIGIGCAESGVRAIMCEKPIGTKLSDADRLIDICEKKGIILAINHSRRWHLLWRKCADFLKTGGIGEIYSAYVQWPTGRIGNVGTHIFDALRMLLNAEPVGVSGTLDPLFYPDCRGPQYKDPGGWGIVQFSNGIRAFINAPQAAKFPLMMKIGGSEGYLTILNNRAIVEFWNGEKQELSVVPDGKTSLDRAIEDIVNCLIYGGQPACTGKDGLMALEIIIGFHVSDRQKGRWVDIPLSGKDREFEVMIG